MGTLNNPGEDAEAFLKRLSEAPGVTYVCGQLESGLEGTEHVQYYVNLKQPQALSFTKKLCARSHWELCRNSNASEKYVLKEDTRVAGPWHFGQRPVEKQNLHDVETARLTRQEQNKKIAEMGAVAAIQEGLVDIVKYQNLKRSLDLYKLDTQPAYEADDVRGIWIHGPPGTGKTHKARHAFDGTIFLKSQSKWWDGYLGQDNAIIDDLDFSGGQTLGHYLKIWADRWACNGEVKGGTVPLTHKRLIITSNYTIRDMFGPSTTDDSQVAASKNILCEALERRFKIIYVAHREDLMEAMADSPVVSPKNQKRQKTQNEVRKPYIFT